MSEDNEYEALSDPRIGVTTVEVSNVKPLVEPYSSTPLVELRPGSIACPFCGNNRFRRSRVRFHDLRELLMMRYPLRCTRCGQRQYNDFILALLTYAPKAHTPRVAQGNETWRSWTEQNPDQPTQIRPMTTALGTRAQRLHPPAAGPRPAPPTRTPSRSNEDNGIW